MEIQHERLGQTIEELKDLLLDSNGDPAPQAPKTCYCTANSNVITVCYQADCSMCCGKKVLSESGL